MKINYIANSANIISRIQKNGLKKADVTLGFIVINISALAIHIFMAQPFSAVVTFSNTLRFTYHWIQTSVLQKQEIRLIKLDEQIQIITKENQYLKENNDQHTALNQRQQKIVSALKAIFNPKSTPSQILPKPGQDKTLPQITQIQKDGLEDCDMTLKFIALNTVYLFSHLASYHLIATALVIINITHFSIQWVDRFTLQRFDTQLVKINAQANTLILENNRFKQNLNEQEAITAQLEAHVEFGLSNQETILAALATSQTN